MRAGSSPARHAAVPRSSPAEAPAVTMPASAPVASAMISLARPWSWAMSTQCSVASCIAAAISGGIGAPLTRVEVPFALMIVGTPSRS